MINVTTAAAASSGTRAQPSPASFPTVYAPTAIRAPCPSEICPLEPASTVSPASTQK